MDRVRSPRIALDARRVVVALMCALMLVVAPQVLAQSKAEPASEPVPLSQLADIIENDDSRARLVSELREAAAKQAPTNESSDVAEAGEKGEAAPPAAQENGALAPPAAAASTTERAQASQHRVSFARRFAQMTAEWAEIIGARIAKTWGMVATINKKHTPGPTFNARAFFSALLMFVWIAASTVVAFFVLRLLAGTLFTVIERFARKGDSGTGVFVHRATAIILAIAVDIAVVLLACGAGYLAGLYAFGEKGNIDTRASLFINAFALVEMAKVAIRALFAARHDTLRLLNIPSSIAAWWSIRLRWFVGVIGYGLLVLVPVVNVQLSFFMGAIVGFVIMLGAYIYALFVIFRNRRLMTWRLMSMADNASIGFFSILYRLLARIWVLLALAYFTTLFVFSQIDPTDALPFMVSATLQTLAAAAVGFGISGVLSKAISRPLTFSEQVHSKMPMLEARVNSYVPTLLKVVRVLILVIFAMVTINAWHLFDFGAWLVSEAGVTTISVVTHVGIVLLAAALLWIVAASVIEHRLSPNTGKGKPTARQETLLELFRNALAIIIITMALMISLSQIGVDIGPLIAGAGVLGLAIGFGAQKLVQDIITGVFIQLENAMNTGDLVGVGGITGTAERLTIRSVSIRDLDGVYHIVPFSSASVVSNYMRDFSYFRNEFRIGYREDIDNAVAYLREAFADLRKDPAVGPNILEDMTVPGVTALDDSSVKIRIMIKTKPGTQFGVGRAFNRLVKIHFDRAGIEIPFPQHTLYFGEDRDGDAPSANIRVLEAPTESANDTSRRKRRKRGDDAAPEETGDAPGD